MYKKLEKRFAKLAISNLTMYVIMIYVIGYVITLVSPGLFNFLILDMSKVAQGEVWRIITWIFTPPAPLSLFTIFALFLYYTVGKGIEYVMGDFVYTLYIIGGFIITVLAVVLTYFVPLILFGHGITIVPSTYYLFMSTFLAFAVSYPEFRINLFMMIPVKAKWLAYIYVFSIVINFIKGGFGTKIIILASVANFIIYYFCGRNGRHLTPSEIKRRHAYKSQIKQHTSITRHRCSICGRTEQDGDLTFRFCSKCNGNYEYCSEHIYTHEHVK